MLITAKPQAISLQTHAFIVLACALCYFYVFQLNLHFFAEIEFAHGVNWIFIPSGLRLLFVLVFTQSGAVGVALGSIAINYLLEPNESHIFNIVTGLISGVAPYLSRWIGIRFLNLDPQLTGFTAGSFLKISVLFSVICASLHQVWFLFKGQSTDFVAGTIAMATGDWFGTVLVLATASLVLKIIKKIKPPSL
jgi:hypothetical protein